MTVCGVVVLASEVLDDHDIIDRVQYLVDQQFIDQSSLPRRAPCRLPSDTTPKVRSRQGGCLTGRARPVAGNLGQPSNLVQPARLASASPALRARKATPGAGDRIGPSASVRPPGTPHASPRDMALPALAYERTPGIAAALPPRL